MLAVSTIGKLWDTFLLRHEHLLKPTPALRKELIITPWLSIHGGNRRWLTRKRLTENY